jgi:electron transfer flavoprotein beta subunit
MRLVVLLRRLRGTPEGHEGYRPAGGLIGRCDEAALRAALALRGETRGATVTALAAGPADREDDVLRHAMTAGADAAVRVSDPGIAWVDYHGVARVLAATLQRVGHDLILAGDRSEDEAQGAVGPAVAEWLQIPHLTGAIDLKLAAENGSAGVLATRRDPGHVRTLKVPLPALITVVSFPRAVTCPAGTAAIQSVDLEALGIQAAELKHRDGCMGDALPVRVTKNATVVKDADELVARLREERLV